METGAVRPLLVDLMADPESGMVDNAVYTLHSLWALVRDALPPSGSGSFSRLLATDPRNPRADNTNFQHIPNFTPNTFNQNQFPIPQPPFNQTQLPTPPPPFNYFHYPQHSSPTQVMHNLNPFGGVSNLQQWMFVGAAAGASSHGSDSATPQSQIRKVEQDDQKQDSSGSSPDEGRRVVRINYSEVENLRLVSLWIKHSVDPIHGIDQTGEAYWKKIAEAFNSGQPEGERRSGESDDMLMDKARATFKRENKQKPFTLEYVWKVLKKEPKWYRSIPGTDCSDKNKRTKVDESGAYTSSSNQDTDEAETFKEVRPEGQKKAKARMRGKGKRKVIPQSPLGS
ncbi:unnamed protein product [Miscanthus lutarioriparius]|uniref:No apical meristem-associated C-terminal domain-containing protein n=1 Tax=Miscanthus lutarioriparius TaxID=422564 RepID=A0A811QTV9_9POAL|nr:unnamed protein product [Miscanthus lutarioriparius]